MKKRRSEGLTNSTQGSQKGASAGIESGLSHADGFKGEKGVGETKKSQRPTAETLATA